ncbi:MAG: membrane protein insertion efficiency factor YidD [Curvibacter sp.]|nr:membrane protein insertion efficiency factor YidD [Curvibacter sp.]
MRIPWADALALQAIQGYRRHLSPHKGFACAYRVHTGRCSCSRFGQRAITRFGLLQGLWFLSGRLQACRKAYGRLLALRREEDESASEWLQRHRDQIDFGCCVGEAVLDCIPF